VFAAPPARFPVERFPANSCTDTDLSIHSLGEQRAPGFLFARSECSSWTKETFERAIDRSKLAHLAESDQHGARGVRAGHFTYDVRDYDSVPHMPGRLCTVGKCRPICNLSIRQHPIGPPTRIEVLGGRFSREDRELRLRNIRCSLADAHH